MRFIELFAGIGGFRLGLERQGHQCVWTSEWLPRPRGIYQYNFGEMPDDRDIRTVPASAVPGADLIVGGFPCATFSVAGKRTGFGLEDTRGTLCFEMLRIAHEKHIPYILFENVKGLLNHDRGRTFHIILCALDEMGYDCQWEVLDSQYFGVPQHRERIFLIANLRGQPRPKAFPLGEPTQNDSENKRLHSKQIFGSLQARMRKGLGNTESRVTSVLVDPLNGEKIRSLDEVIASNIPVVMIPEATKEGGVLAEEGDSINLAFLTSKTRRGRVRKGIAHTLDTAPQQYTIVGQRVFEGGQATVNDPNGVSQTLVASATGGPSGNLPYVPVATQQVKMGIHSYNGIRKLTPLECERLQGLPDNFTKFRVDNCKVVENSDSERYERCGRTVTIPVIEAIGKKLGKEWYA